VTVLRTPFDVANAPMSVAAVGRHQAAAARPGFALDEVLGQVAGVQVDNRLNFALGERLSIRGIGARAQFGVRGVRVIVDGIPGTTADGQTELTNVDLGSIGGAQVIRGPASALYGNSSGGVVTLTTAAPPAVPFAPSFRTVYGSDALARLQLGAGGTTGRASYSVTADRLDYGGYRAYSHARNAHANLVSTYELPRGTLRLVANAVAYNAQNPGALSDSLLRVDRRQAFAGNVAQRTGEWGHQGQLGVAVHTILGPGELRASLYGLHRALVNPIPPRIIALARTAGGARLAYAMRAGGASATAASLTTIVGGETDLQRDDRQNWVNQRGVRGTLVLDQLEHVTSLSPFAQVTFHRGPLAILGGVRYDEFRFAAADRLVTATNPNDSGVRRMSAVSPSVGATVTLAPALRVYATVATGFQTPTTTELANRPDGAGGFNPTLQPEHVHSREIGVKGSVAALQYDLAAYDMRVDDELIPFEVPSAPGRQFYRNAGAARHRGVEADVDVLLGEAFGGAVLARATYTYVDARFISYVANGVSLAGNRVPGVAPHLGTAGLDWRFASGAFVSAEERAESAIPVDDANNARSPGYVVTNVRGEVPLARVARGRVALIGGIGNVFGALYNTSVVVNAFGGRYYEPAAGRTIYAGLTLRH